LIMLLFAPLASYVPLSCLAAVLVIVAWNMSELDRFMSLLSAPMGDRLVLLSTFLLTILVDLTVAIEVGVVMAALLFMHRMSGAVEIATHMSLIQDDQDDFSEPQSKKYVPGHGLPAGIETYEITGPFFFGTVSLLADVLDRIDATTKVIILRLRNVPLIDATGTNALADFIKRSHSRGTVVILSEAQPATTKVLTRLKSENMPDNIFFAATFDEAKKLALSHFPAS
ncbi:MAG: STAS domain-containing protein, partial [Sneathiella sp.]|nr:STAS domain-containing protein [Sneathiella sp.]